MKRFFRLHTKIYERLKLIELIRLNSKNFEKENKNKIKSSYTMIVDRGFYSYLSW